MRGTPAGDPEQILRPILTDVCLLPGALVKGVKLSEVGDQPTGLWSVRESNPRTPVPWTGAHLVSGLMTSPGQNPCAEHARPNPWGRSTRLWTDDINKPCLQSAPARSRTWSATFAESRASTTLRGRFNQAAEPLQSSPPAISSFLQFHDPLVFFRVFERNRTDTFGFTGRRAETTTPRTPCRKRVPSLNTRPV